MRECRKCHIEKEDQCFSKNGYNCNGDQLLQVYCKSCVHLRYKEKHPNALYKPRWNKGKSSNSGKVSKVYKKILKNEYWQCIITLSDRKLSSNKVTYEDIPQLIKEEYQFMIKGYSFI